jgi:NTP pyrophosphatase (non-canonical NTP hydrolase)
MECREQIVEKAKDYMCSDIALDAIRSGTARAIARHGIDKTVRNPKAAWTWKLSVLMEEVGEVARVFNELWLGNIKEEQAKNMLMKELVDVGATVALWLDAEDEKS